MSHKDLDTKIPVELQTGYVHIAISVGSKENVIDITNKIISDGFKLYSKPRLTGDGYFESVVFDIDGNSVEITI